jgi:hypothetical protein
MKEALESRVLPSTNSDQRPLLRRIPGRIHGDEFDRLARRGIPSVTIQSLIPWFVFNLAVFLNISLRENKSSSRGYLQHTFF